MLTLLYHTSTVVKNIAHVWLAFVYLLLVWLLLTKNRLRWVSCFKTPLKVQCYGFQPRYVDSTLSCCFRLFGELEWEKVFSTLLFLTFILRKFSTTWIFIRSWKHLIKLGHSYVSHCQHQHKYTSYWDWLQHDLPPCVQAHSEKIILSLLVNTI